MANNQANASNGSADADDKANSDLDLLFASDDELSPEQLAARKQKEEQEKAERERERQILTQLFKG